MLKVTEKAAKEFAEILSGSLAESDAKKDGKKAIIRFGWTEEGTSFNYTLMFDVEVNSDDIVIDDNKHGLKFVYSKLHKEKLDNLIVDIVTDEADDKMFSMDTQETG